MMIELCADGSNRDESGVQPAAKLAEASCGMGAAAELET
jgi:hypothetical protein